MLFKNFVLSKNILKMFFFLLLIFHQFCFCENQISSSKVISYCIWFFDKLTNTVHTNWRFLIILYWSKKSKSISKLKEGASFELIFLNEYIQLENSSKKIKSLLKRFKIVFFNYKFSTIYFLQKLNNISLKS